MSRFATHGPTPVGFAVRLRATHPIRFGRPTCVTCSAAWRSPLLGLAVLAGCDGGEATTLDTNPGTNPPGFDRQIPADKVEGSVEGDTPLDANGTKRE